LTEGGLDYGLAGKGTETETETGIETATETETEILTGIDTGLLRDRAGNTLNLCKLQGHSC
jgi:hypothetical protein